MNAAAKKIADEIGSLLDGSSTFIQRYNSALNGRIAIELYEELLYFHTRCTYIFTELKKDAYVKILAQLKFRHINLSGSQLDSPAEMLIEIRTVLKITKRELEEGLLFKVSDLMKAEVFANFLEYARHLLDEGFKEAAAVMIGGVLEEQLRNLCLKNNLPIKKSNGDSLTIAPMNENLYNGQHYNLLTKNQITAFATIRNDAAHGTHDTYTIQNVEDMYKYVLNFSI